MRTMTMLALAATVTTTAVPAAAYYLTRPSEDPLGGTLREYGFVPIRPPSNLMNVGSLYYVDSRVKDFKAICNAEQADSQFEGHGRQYKGYRETCGRVAERAGRG